MVQGLSLHIGLNGVDASKYNGWPGTLAGCVNDANAMQAIASAQGFTPTQLITEAATADAILTEIGKAAHTLQSGDTFLISYSGHGGQVPDPTGDSPDGLDDTWVAYDRQLLGHELYNLWGQFAAGVRIEVYSDSCHSGTVIRDFIQGSDLSPYPRPSARSSPGVARMDGDLGARAFNTVYRAAPVALARGGPVATIDDTLKKNSRSIPAQLALQLYSQNKAMYQALQWSRKRDAILASVILISGCQDNQESQDGENNGLFTEKLLAVWNNGQFQGTLPQFHKAIVALMPSTQTPNYFTVGVDDPDFTNARPLTIVGATASSDTTGSTTTTSTPPQPGTSTPPSVTVVGSGSLDRDTDGPPSFTVNPGSNPYYIFEITSDPALFGNDANRSESTFYASWADSNATARMTDPQYTLPQAAWDALKGNDKLYYRVGSTTSQNPNEWANYLVSVTDADAPSLAPSISITGSKATATRGVLDGSLEGMESGVVDIGTY